MARCLNYQYLKIWLLWRVFDSFYHDDNENQHGLSLFWVWNINKLKIIKKWLDALISNISKFGFYGVFAIRFCMLITNISMVFRYFEYGAYISWKSSIMARCLNYQYFQIWLLWSAFDSLLHADDEYQHGLSLFRVLSKN